MIREFRGTTEPGGRTGHTDEDDRDPDTQGLDPDQQTVYDFDIENTSKLGRPTAGPCMVTEDGEPAVVAPPLEGRATYREPAGAGTEAPPEAELAEGVDPTTLRDRQRTTGSTGGRRDREHGIAIHSGAGGDVVHADSTGCQVVQGDWYGNYVMTIRRALDCARVREARARGEAATRAADADTPGSGYLLYSLIEAADLNRDVRGAIAERRRPVMPDGGVIDRDADVHAHAERGVSGSAQALPHLDTIQAAFGHHDVGGVRAHLDGSAAEATAAIGAGAYATGDDIAFARTPDLRQAAHEAAHVVQQRGGVRLDGGVGRAGDGYEQHADAVADLVVRGESAESLLDTMAHRGPAGGPAVQGEFEDTDALGAALDAVDDVSDLEPAQDDLDAIHEHLPTDRNTEYEVHIGTVVHRVRGGHLRWLRSHVTSRRRALERMGVRGSGPWEPPNAPLRGQTIGNGHEIVAHGEQRRVTVRGIDFLIKPYHGIWGLEYDGSLSAASEAAAAAARFDADGPSYRGAAARGMTVMREGLADSINTYDGMTLTVGLGFSGGRLNQVFEMLDEPAREALGRLSHFAGGTFDGSEDIILDVDTLADLVHVIRDHGADFCRAMVQGFVEGSALPPDGRAHTDREESERVGEELVDEAPPELIAIAAYLSHGLPAFMPDPPLAVRHALDARPGNVSAQLAVVLQGYAGRCADARDHRHSLYARHIDDIVEKRIPHKVTNFITEMTRRDATFAFDLGAAQGVIPCLQADGPFTSTDTQPDGGIWLDREHGDAHEFYDFGDPV
jgi:hypothetical protein